MSADFMSVSRRRWLVAASALATCFIGEIGSCHAQASAAAPLTQLILPKPTGAYAIGTVSLHLIDRSRQDPYESTPQSRELMVSVWYPARASAQGESVPWMPAAALSWFRPQLAEFFSQAVSPPDAPPPDAPRPESAALDGASSSISLDGVHFPLTHATNRASVLAGESCCGFPVVLFSPGYGVNREQGTALVEDLASHGYVVVTVSHTYESAEVQFPRGRVELGRHDLDMSPHLAVALRRDDVRFVLDQLQEIAAGRNPDAERRVLPVGLNQALDLTRVGMFGHSLGGATTLQVMANDRRVRAGVDLDGTVFTDLDLFNSAPADIEAAMTQLAVSVTDRPFMFMTSGSADPQRFFGPVLGSFWDNLYGWRRFLSLSRSSHYSYTDNELLLQQCIAAGIVPAFPPEVDLIDANRAVAVERAYLRAFFDRSLRGRALPLLDGPSARFPEITFH